MNDKTTAGAAGVPVDQAPTSSPPPTDIAATIANAADEVADFVSENVGVVIAGGLAIGLVAAALLPRKKKSKISKQARTIAAIVSELSTALAAQAGAAADESRARLQGVGKAMTETVVEHSQDIGKQAQQIATGTADQLNDSGKAIARALVKLVEKVRR